MTTLMSRAERRRPRRFQPPAPCLNSTELAFASHSPPTRLTGSYKGWAAASRMHVLAWPVTRPVSAPDQVRHLSDKRQKSPRCFNWSIISSAKPLRRPRSEAAQCGLQSLGPMDVRKNCERAVRDLAKRSKLSCGASPGTLVQGLFVTGTVVRAQRWV